jgi:simple sugar transport system permease protein
MSGLESTISDFLKLTFLSMVPFVLASQGTMLGGRTGVFNVAQEGIMLVGASVGFLVSYFTGSNLVGALVAMLVGGLFGLILAYFTTTLKMDQFVIGLALFFIGTGLSSLLPKLVIGVTLTPPLVRTLPDIAIPLLSKIPILGPVLFKQNILVYFSILLSIGLWYALYRTNTGLRLRSVGENPKAADALGISVVSNRYITAILGGMLIGLAGAYLPMVYTGTSLT